MLMCPVVGPSSVSSCDVEQPARTNKKKMIVGNLQFIRMIASSIAKDL
jgi:hypothetical protein